jgi:hypothetical protein
VAQRVPGGLGSQISWHLALEGSEVVTLTHRPPLPPGMFLVLGTEPGYFLEVLIDPHDQPTSRVPQFCFDFLGLWFICEKIRVSDRNKCLCKDNVKMGSD